MKVYEVVRGVYMEGHRSKGVYFSQEKARAKAAEIAVFCDDTPMNKFSPDWYTDDEESIYIDYVQVIEHEVIM